MFKKTRLSLAVGAAFGLGIAGMHPTGAIAQTQQLERVEVTGSNIRRLDTETASPLQVITQEEMVRQGYTRIDDVLRDVTANGQGLLSQGFSRAFAGRAAGVALRGLGVGATLVLIDGVRMAPYPLSDDNQRNFVDISAIPFAAIERVEILLDGASAIYGSDAIGGVVNVILKKNFTGTGLVADAGTTTRGGGTIVHAALTQGFGAPADKYNGFVALEYRKQSEILLKDRSGDWTNFNWTSQGGQDIRPGARAPAAGITSPYVLTPYLQNRGESTSDPANYAFLGSGCNFTALRSNGCVFQDTQSQVQPETQNINLLGRFNAKLGSDWEAAVTASWFNSTSQNSQRQTNIPAGSFAGNTVIGLGITPYISPPIAAYTVPANYPGNTFGVPANVRAIVPDVGWRLQNFDSDAMRLVGNLRGSSWGWDFNAAAGLTAVKTNVKYSGYIDQYAMYAALNDPVNPFRLTGGNSADVLAKVSPPMEKNVSSNLNFIQAVGSRELMPLDGGALGFAAGAGYVYTKQYAPNPSQVSSGQVGGPNAAFAAGTQNNANVFFELNAPVMKTLELNAALRYDYYDTYGGAWTPKVGGKWTPMPEVGIRGTWGQGFRAPSAPESQQGMALFGFNAIRDPLLCPVSNANGTPDTTSPQNVPAYCTFAPTYLQVPNPDLKAEKSDNWTIGMVLEPVKKWVTSFDYYSITVKNQIIPAASLSTYNPLNYAVRSTPQQVTFGDGSTGLSSVGPIQFSYVPYVNGQKVETTGLDFSTTYSWALADAGNFSATLNWSHIFTYDITVEGTKYRMAGTHGPTIVSGNTGNPKDRGQLALGWARGPWMVTGTANYVGSFDMTDPSVGITTCEDGINAQNGQRWVDVTPPTQYCKANSFWYMNLNVQYRFNKQLMVQLSGTNIFGNQPPVDMGSYAGTGLNLTSNQTGAPYNPSLHGPGVIGPFWSLGVNYSF